MALITSPRPGKRAATLEDMGVKTAPVTPAEAAAKAIESAVIPGTGADAAPGLDDLDSILLGTVSEAEGTATAEATGKTPIIVAPAKLIKQFVEGSKMEKDGKAKKEAAGELLIKHGAPKRVEMSRGGNAFLSSVKMVADGPVEVEKLVDGKPVQVKQNVEGAVLLCHSRYTPVKPDFDPATKKGRDAQTLLGAYAATLGPDWKKYVGATRTLVAKDALLADKAKLALAMDVLKKAGLGGYFEVQYEFMPTDEFFKGSTMDPALEAKSKALESQKLIKPKKDALKVS
jgi:hypothetical protein